MRRRFLIQLNIFNITFETKPRFHAEPNFSDISANKIYEKAILPGMLSQHLVIIYNLASDLSVFQLVPLSGTAERVWPMDYIFGTSASQTNQKTQTYIYETEKNACYINISLHLLMKHIYTTGIPYLDFGAKFEAFIPLVTIQPTFCVSHLTITRDKINVGLKLIRHKID